MRGTPRLLSKYDPCRRIIPAHAGNSQVNLNKCLLTPDHPRACGELAAAYSSSGTTDGSSPRMRGTHPMRTLHSLRTRIIPAHAGNSSDATQRASRVPDHPRACGELSSRVMELVGSAGSSPRMRGTPRPTLRRALALRIIPAHAGNSKHFQPRIRIKADHPRACGELGWPAPLPDTTAGSSPRMRGTRLKWCRSSWSKRIIPAHAGNSIILPLLIWEHTDHPRACGELLHLHCPSRPLRGSSPAHAGNSVFRSLVMWSAPDHPRACGELAHATSCNGTSTGSSPRMRGTLERRLSVNRVLRIIPAHAGNSRRAPVQIGSDPDHPRACGELCVQPCQPFIRIGSSPRMRGTLWPDCRT